MRLTLPDLHDSQFMGKTLYKTKNYIKSLLFCQQWCNVISSWMSVFTLGSLLQADLLMQDDLKSTCYFVVVTSCRVAYFRLCITGPVSHYFYQLMEVWMPSTDPYCIIKRLLLDRLIFAPGFLLIFYFVMNILEVGHLTADQFNNGLTSNLLLHLHNVSEKTVLKEKKQDL